MQTNKEDSCLLFSSDVFPQNARTKDQSSIPWGVAIQPLNPRVETCKLSITQSQIPRCQRCFGYLNMYSMFDSKSWQCPLCLYRNVYDKSMLNNRYATSVNRSRSEECLYPNYSMDLPVSEVSRSVPYKDTAREVLVLIIDCTAYKDYLEFIKSTLHTLVESYSDHADIMIFTSGDRLGVYNIKHAITKYTRLSSSFAPKEDATNSNSFTSIPLSCIMSFEESSANLGTYRQQALNAIDSIRQLRGEFCFAETVQMVMNYLESIYKDGLIIGGRVICSICRNSENPSINPNNDNCFPPSNEQDATNRLSASNPTYTTISSQLQQIGLSLSIINNITNNTLYNVQPNHINPSLLYSLCNDSNGNLMCLDIQDEESKAHIIQTCLAFLHGEYGFDCIFRIRSSGGVIINSISSSSSSVDSTSVGIRGLQFSSNSSDINHISTINACTVIPFDFQYSSPSGSTITADDFPLIQLVCEYSTMKKVEKENGCVMYIPIRRMIVYVV